MAEIPGVVWMAVGILVTIFSFLVAVVRKVGKPAFFYLMMVVGIIMIVYGFIKMKMGKRNFEEKIAERRSVRSDDRYVEIEGKSPYGAGSFNKHTAQPANQVQANPQHTQQHQPVQRHQGHPQHNTVHHNQPAVHGHPRDSVSLHTIHNQAGFQHSAHMGHVNHGQHSPRGQQSQHPVQGHPRDQARAPVDQGYRVAEQHYRENHHVPTFQHHNQSQSKFCPQCGAPLGHQYKFCHECGAKLL